MASASTIPETLPQKCYKKLGNNDTRMKERIALIIDDSLLLTDHLVVDYYGRQVDYNTHQYNFPGGAVPYEYLRKNIGETSLKELKEELGITFHQNPEIKLAGYLIDKSKYLILLVVAKVSLDDILFTKATHIWESKSFTLMPVEIYPDCIQNDILGYKLQENIREANKPCATHINYKERDTIIDKTKIEDGKKNIIFKQNDEYFVKLAKNPRLSNDDKRNIKNVNNAITGYNDSNHIYGDDFICKYTYCPYDGCSYDDNPIKPKIHIKKFKCHKYNKIYNVVDNMNFENVARYIYENESRFSESNVMNNLDGKLFESKDYLNLNIDTILKNIKKIDYIKNDIIAVDNKMEKYEPIETDPKTPIEERRYGLYRELKELAVVTLDEYKLLYDRIYAKYDGIEPERHEKYMISIKSDFFCELSKEESEYGFLNCKK